MGDRVGQLADAVAGAYMDKLCAEVELHHAQGIVYISYINESG